VPLQDSGVSWDLQETVGRLGFSDLGDGVAGDKWLEQDGGLELLV